MIRSTHPTLIGAALPAARLPAVVRHVLLAVCGSLFVAAAAQIQVPLWPVPITGQTFAVLVLGLAYGWRLGAATLLLYMAEGAAGLPVFAHLSAGAAVIAGPTGGYIVGFVAAAALTGYLAQRGWDRRPVTTGLAMLAGNIVIWLPGLAWLTLFYLGPGAAYVEATGATTALGAALTTGAAPFLVGDALKLVLAACLMPLAWRLVGRRPTGYLP